MIPRDGQDDPALGVLSALPLHEPDRDRKARIRAQAHGRLAGRAGRKPRLVVVPIRGWRRVLEPALVGAAGATYLAEVVRAALRLYGF